MNFNKTCFHFQEHIENINFSNFGATQWTESLPSYKEVVRECPMALPVIQDLLELGVDGNEVNSLVMHGISGPHLAITLLYHISLR